MESRTLRRSVAAVVVVAALGGAAWWMLHQRGANDSAVSKPKAVAEQSVRRVVPEGTRIRVEVINTTNVRGLGRKATMYLRDAGFDVVRFTGEGPARDSTMVLDRTGHAEWAKLASGALGGARFEMRPDSTRYVDLTVLLGADWRPPAKTLYP